MVEEFKVRRKIILAVELNEMLVNYLFKNNLSLLLILASRVHVIELIMKLMNTKVVGETLLWK